MRFSISVLPADVSGDYPTIDMVVEGEKFVAPHVGDVSRYVYDDVPMVSGISSRTHPQLLGLHRTGETTARFVLIPGSEAEAVRRSIVDRLRKYMERESIRRRMPEGYISGKMTFRGSTPPANSGF